MCSSKSADNRAIIGQRFQLKDMAQEAEKAGQLQAIGLADVVGGEKNVVRAQCLAEGLLQRDQLQLGDILPLLNGEDRGMALRQVVDRAFRRARGTPSHNSRSPPSLSVM